MANWCVNYLTIEGPETEVERFKATVIRERGMDFDTIIPMPDQFKVDGKDVWDETLGSDGLDARNTWTTENWGTTGIRDWQVDEDLPGRYSCRVYTTWDAPMPVFRKLVAMFPAVTFDICGGALASPPEWTYEVTIKDGVFEIWDTSEETWEEFEREYAAREQAAVEAKDEAN